MFIVLMNGAEFAKFKTRHMAVQYAQMQRCKIKGAGLAINPKDIPEAKKSFAAKQNWEVKAA